MHNTSVQNTRDWSSLIFGEDGSVCRRTRSPLSTSICLMFCRKTGKFSVAYRSSVRYRLNYGLKGPSNPKQPTNQLIEAIYTQKLDKYPYIIPYAKLTIVVISLPRMGFASFWSARGYTSKLRSYRFWKGSVICGPYIGSITLVNDFLFLQEAPLEERSHNWGSGWLSQSLFCEVQMSSFMSVQCCLRDSFQRMYIYYHASYSSDLILHCLPMSLSWDTMHR